MESACRPRRRQPVSLSTAFLFALAGCSPYAFREPVNDFAVAAEGMMSAISAGRQAVAADQRALVRLDVMDGRLAPALRGNCVAVTGAPVGEPCRVGPAGDDRRYRTAFPLREDQLARLQGLDRYARSLRALVRAEDREAMNAASTKAAEAIGALAGTVAPAAPAAMLAGPVVNFALYLVGEALDTERYLQLRRAVDEADPALATLRDPLVRLLSFIRNQRLRVLSDMATSLVQGMPAQRSAEARGRRFDEAATRAQAIAALMAEDPAKPVDAMIAAHTALRAALNDRSTNAAALAAAVRAFAAQVETLKAAFEAASSQGG